MDMKNSAKTSAIIARGSLGFFSLLALILAAGKVFSGYNVSWFVIVIVAMIPFLVWVGIMVVIGLVVLILWILAWIFG